MQRNHRRQVIPQRTDSFLEKYAPSTKNQLIQDQNRFNFERIFDLYLIIFILVKIG
jgi:hypothetical protein